MIERFRKWISPTNDDEDDPGRFLDYPSYPLMPLSNGFILSMTQALNKYEDGLNLLNIPRDVDAGGSD
jgi:hypothetical protein